MPPPTAMEGYLAHMNQINQLYDNSLKKVEAMLPRARPRPGNSLSKSFSSTASSAATTQEKKKKKKKKTGDNSGAFSALSSAKASSVDAKGAASAREAPTREEEEEEGEEADLDFESNAGIGFRPTASSSTKRKDGGDAVISADKSLQQSNPLLRRTLSLGKRKGRIAEDKGSRRRARGGEGEKSSSDEQTGRSGLGRAKKRKTKRREEEEEEEEGEKNDDDDGNAEERRRRRRRE